jgi:hypothetical protein
MASSTGCIDAGIQAAHQAIHHWVEWVHGASGHAIIAFIPSPAEPACRGRLSEIVMKLIQSSSVGKQ